MSNQVPTSWLSADTTRVQEIIINLSDTWKLAPQPPPSHQLSAVTHYWTKIAFFFKNCLFLLKIAESIKNLNSKLQKVTSSGTCVVETVGD